MVRTRATRVCLVATAVTLLISPPVGAVSHDCETKSERPRSEIIVAFEGPTPRRDYAVSILPGEVRCVTGSIRELRNLEDLRVVESSRGATGPVIALRLQRGGKTRLTARHSSDEVLRFRARPISGELNLATLGDSRWVAPNEVRTEQWEPSVHKVLVDLVEFWPVEREPEPFVRRAEDRDWFGGQIWIGARGTQLDALDATLAADGFAPLPKRLVMGGMEADASLRRFRFAGSLGGGGGATHNRASPEELSASLFEGGFTLGYDVFRYRYLSLYLGAGMSGGNFRLWTPEKLTPFKRQLDPSHDGNASWSYRALRGEAGIDYFIPLSPSRTTWALRLGTRLTWAQQVGADGWEFNDPDEDGDRFKLTGPHLDLSGPSAKLTLGFGWLVHH